MVKKKKKSEEKLYTSWTCPPGRPSPLAGLAEANLELVLTEEDRERAKKRLEEAIKPYKSGNGFIHIKGLGYLRR